MNYHYFAADSPDFARLPPIGETLDYDHDTAPLPQARFAFERRAEAEAHRAAHGGALCLWIPSASCQQQVALRTVAADVRPIVDSLGHGA